MAPRHALIGVEGPHDQALVQRLLKVLGFKSSSRLIEALDPFWKRFIPNYPKGGDLYARLDMPSILARKFESGNELSVAIYAGGGLGIVADADKRSIQQVVAEYRKAFEPLFPQFPQAAGQVATGRPRTGIYVLPDNSSPGVLEHLLLDCGKHAYEPLRRAADAYLDSLDAQHKAHWGPFSEQKARIAATVSVLQPGKTNTVSIVEDEWISSATLASVPRLAQFAGFLRELLALPAGNT